MLATQIASQNISDCRCRVMCSFLTPLLSCTDFLISTISVRGNHPCGTTMSIVTVSFLSKAGYITILIPKVVIVSAVLILKHNIPIESNLSIDQTFALQSSELLGSACQIVSELINTVSAAGNWQKTVRRVGFGSMCAIVES